MNRITFLFLSTFLFACNVPKTSPAEAAESRIETAVSAGYEFATDPVPVAITGACPIDMVEINSDYCPNVEEICLYDVDSHGNRLPGEHKAFGSCGEFKYPTRCLSDHRVHMNFCIDRFEFPNKEGVVPRDWMTWYDAKNEAAKLGKRLCTDREWTLAAEGNDIKPLPYGDGYHRDHSCNIDRHAKVDVFKATSPHSPMSEVLRSLLVPSGSMPGCHSDFGVYDMSGNIDEFVENVGGITSCSKGRCGGWISGLKGGHVWHVRQASRPMTDGHGPTFGWYETGTRSCCDVK